MVRSTLSMFSVFAVLVLSSDPFTADAASAFQRDNEGASDRLVIPFGSPLRPLPFALLTDRRAHPKSLTSFVDRLNEGLPILARQRLASYFSSNWSDLKGGAYDGLYLHEIVYAAMSKWHLNKDVNFSNRIQCVGEGFADQVGLQIAFDYTHRNWKEGETIELTERARGLTEAYYISKRLFKVCDGYSRSPPDPRP